MLLSTDIGNTNVSFGVFENEKLIAKWRMATVRDRTSDEIGVLLRQFFLCEEIDYQNLSGIIISSVVPSLNSAFQKMFLNYFGIKSIFVDHTFDFGFKINYEPPESIGIDRLVAIFAAVHKYGKPCIVCDFGTATTIDAVNSQNEFPGGIIAPGMNILADALFQKTAQLPQVKMDKTTGIFGNTTVKAIQSGIYFGYMGLVEKILDKMITELAEKPKIIATGGLASTIAEGSEMIEIVDEYLMLDGLRLIFEQSFSKKN